MTLIPKPESTNRCNNMVSMVVSWLLNSISTDIRLHICLLHNKSQMIWLFVFVDRTCLSVFQLRKDIASIHQDTLSVIAYFTKYRTLVTERTIWPLSTNVCASTN